MTAQNHPPDELSRDVLLEVIGRLGGHRLMVIGDAILDEYLIGRTDRLSREAPIPVLEFERRDLILGGAANPSANIVSLGSSVIQVGVVGEDEQGARLRKLLADWHIDPAGMVSDSGRPTTTKTRIMAHMGLRFPQQVARIDSIDRHPVEGSVERAVVEKVRTLASEVDAIMVSDYLIGLLTEPIITAIREVSRARRLLLTADAQGQLDKYAGFDLVKCNADEAAHYLRQDLKTHDDFSSAGTAIIGKLALCGGMLITRGPDGVTLVQKEQPAQHLRAPHIEDVYDTVGAGDTVLAVMTLALVSRASYRQAAALANLAAGIVVRKVGNYAPSPDELRAAVTQDSDMRHSHQGIS